MSFNNEYQRGPVHVGRVAMTFRAYAWTQEDIDKYLKMRQDEDFELLGMIDHSVEAAMEALGDELKKYLEEAEEEMGLSEKKEEETIQAKGPGLLDPFSALAGGVKDAFRMIIPAGEKKSSKQSGDSGTAAKIAQGTMWQVYKNFKASHGMMKW